MPFTLKERRQPMIEGRLKEPERGDFCFLEYRPMILAWNKSPRWSTADRIYREYLLKRLQSEPMLDTIAALDLAWQVFFNLHVMPYEVKKREENGEVE